MEGSSLKPGTWSLSFRTTCPAEQLLKEHVSYRAVLVRSVLMDAASVQALATCLLYVVLVYPHQRLGKKVL